MDLRELARTILQTNSGPQLQVQAASKHAGTSQMKITLVPQHNHLLEWAIP